MNLFFTQKNRNTSRVYRFCTVLLLCALFFNTAGLRVQKAEAISVVVTGGNGTVQETISAVANVAQQISTKALEIKEYILDKIAFGIARIALNQIRRSILRWINSGFKGSPAFVTDLQGFLINAADQVAGELIYGTELGFLCRPFELQVRLGLNLNYRPSARDRVQCTLSQVSRNVENFLSGDYLDGGMAGWFHLTQNPNNNFFGAQANAQRLLVERINQKIVLDLNKLLWSNGTLSKEICSIIGDEQNCSVTMPGKAISEMLTFELQSGEKALLNADEINEVISALFAQLAQQALTGAGGLLGLTRTGGSFGSSSYVDRMGTQQFDPIAGEDETGVSEGGLFGDAIAGENQYRALYAGVVSRADSIIVQAQSSACSDANSIVPQVTPILNDALSRQSAADANLALLRDMQARYNTAEPDDQLPIAQEFATLQANSNFHTTVTNVQERFRVEGIMGQLASITTQLNSLCGTPGGGQIGGE